MSTSAQPALHPYDIPHFGEVLERSEGRNYSVVYVGEPQKLRQYGIKHPLISRPSTGKVFLKEALGLSGMEVSFGVMAAGAAVPFRHKHKQNEELYLFIQGQGQMQIDGETFEVKEGTAVRVAPDGARCWRNTGDQDLFYLCIQAKEHSLTAWTLADGEEVPGKVEWP